MLRSRSYIAGFIALLLLAAGCGGSARHGSREAALTSLSPDDRRLAESQGYCAVTSEPLGEMGPPLKLILNERSVWICCSGCAKKARANPPKTIAHAEALRAKVAARSVPREGT